MYERGKRNSILQLYSQYRERKYNRISIATVIMLFRTILFEHHKREMLLHF